jgi:DNA (cytosine-5)-methyltransferase 1
MSKIVPASFPMPIAEVARLIEAIPLRLEEIGRQLELSERTIYRWRSGTTSPRLAELEKLRRIAYSYTRQVDGRPDFRFVDLFAGIGGLRLGVEAIGGRCVFTCERDRFSQQTYKANFADGPDHEIANDITTVDPEEIPKHDLLLAGFPCQPFSIAGVSKKNALGRPHGFSCLEQGNLFFNIADIIAAHRPAAFILENVKNLRSHDKGRTFARIRETIEETLGYTISTRVIDARSFVPQHRERIFIVGFREDVGFSFDDVRVPDCAMGPRLSAILHPEDGSQQAEEPYTTGRCAQVSDKYILTNHLWNYLKRYAEKHQAKGNGFGYGLFRPGDVARTLSARYYKDGSEILIHRGRKNPRRLTPRECARLMGFDRGDRKFVIRVSDTQAYRQFGNSVVVPVVEAVAAAVIPPMMRLISGEQPELPFVDVPPSLRISA